MVELTMIKCTKETRQQLKVLAAKAGVTMVACLAQLVTEASDKRILLYEAMEYEPQYTRVRTESPSGSTEDGA